MLQPVFNIHTEGSPFLGYLGYLGIPVLQLIKHETHHLIYTGECKKMEQKSFLQQGSTIFCHNVSIQCTVGSLSDCVNVFLAGQMAVNIYSQKFGIGDCIYVMYSIQFMEPCHHESFAERDVHYLRLCRIELHIIIMGP